MLTPLLIRSLAGEGFLVRLGDVAVEGLDM